MKVTHLSFAYQKHRNGRLNIRYKFNKKYIIFNTLLRLININIKLILFEDHSKLDVFYNNII